MNLSLLDLQILRAKTQNSSPQPVGMLIHPYSWAEVKLELEKLFPTNGRSLDLISHQEFDKYCGIDVVEDYIIAPEKTEIYFCKTEFQNRIKNLENS